MVEAWSDVAAMDAWQAAATNVNGGVVGDDIMFQLDLTDSNYGSVLGVTPEVEIYDDSYLRIYWSGMTAS